MASNSNAKPLKPINIVVLGESGAGKSTWINAFANFVYYELLEDAEKGKLVTLIPSEFTLCDENFTQVKIRTGRNSKNENFTAGQSATQSCTAYTFKIGDYLIRLIDTPGIGDTRGIIQDSNNLRNIIRMLGNFEEIHGICVLLKPNNARLNFMFRFCINKLFTCLHQSASKNLLFCFTNTRGTFYRPGESITALRELIKENKSIGTLSRNQIYCFDSEAYRYLAAGKNATPVKFPTEDRAHFEVSWKKSMSETKRMLRNILSLEPHTFKSTLEVNRGNFVFEKIVGKFMQINRNIKANKSIIQDKQREIEDMYARRIELETKVMTTKTVIETRSLSYPRTVCSNSKCVRVWTQDNQQLSEHVHICHCYCICFLPNVRENVIGDPNLMQCSCFMNGICSHYRCGHSYREHLRVYCELVPVTKKVKDLQVAGKLIKLASQIQIQRNSVMSKIEEIRKYKLELEFLLVDSALIVKFLEQNSIKLFNDAIDEYVNHSIQEVESKENSVANLRILEKLRDLKDCNLARKHIIEKYMEKYRANLQGYHFDFQAVYQTLQWSSELTKDIPSSSDIILEKNSFKDAQAKQIRNLGNNFLNENIQSGQRLNKFLLSGFMLAFVALCILDFFQNVGVFWCIGVFVTIWKFCDNLGISLAVFAFFFHCFWAMRSICFNCGWGFALVTLLFVKKPCQSWEFCWSYLAILASWDVVGHLGLFGNLGFCWLLHCIICHHIDLYSG